MVSFFCCFLDSSLASHYFHPVSVVSPLNIAEFGRELSGHPDREAVSYVLNGLQHGFRLGFQHLGGSRRLSQTNCLLVSTLR